MRNEKAINHGGHGEHGEKARIPSMSFAVPAVFAVVKLSFLR